jgi:hypothetical protein
MPERDWTPHSAWATDAPEIAALQRSEKSRGNWTMLVFLMEMAMNLEVQHPQNRGEISLPEQKVSTHINTKASKTTTSNHSKNHRKKPYRFSSSRSM